jgi:hypothetical protein
MKIKLLTIKKYKNNKVRIKQKYKKDMPNYKEIFNKN